MPRIFFSYSWKQKITGAYICDLLIANGASLFRDELCIEPGEDFKVRIVKEIQQADYFIYLDSEAARSSTWIPFEVNQFMKKKSPENFIVCLGQETGEWRKQNSFFEGMDTITYFELIAREDGFDPYNTFRRSIESLCKRIGLTYRDEVEWPREDDLRNEIHAMMNNHTESPLRQLLLDDFNTALSLEKFSAPSVTQRFRNLADDCLTFKLKVTTPSIALCLALAKDGQHEEARTSASALIDAGVDKDPRIWHVRAGATFCRDVPDKDADYSMALQDYEQVIRLIDASGNPNHIHQRWYAIANAVSCLFRLHRYDEACTMLSDLSVDQRNTAGLSRAMVQLIEEGIEDAAQKKKYKTASLLASTLFGMFDGYQNIARGLLLMAFYTEPRHFLSAQTAMRLRKIDQAIPITPDDYYHKGLIHYVLGMDDHEKYFRHSNAMDTEDRESYEDICACYNGESPFFHSNISALIEKQQSKKITHG